MNRFDTFRGTANQLLFIVDTCPGAGVAEAGEVASALREERPPNAEHVWFGILVSCSATDIGARDGAFGESLLRLFREGPRSPDMRRRWSKHDRWIRGEDLGQAVLEDWTGEDQRPDFLRGGRVWVLDGLGRYVVQDGEGGTAVYRVAHQSLADHLRPPYRRNGERPFDPAAGPVWAALAARYAGLIDSGHRATTPTYLWRYAYRHAAAVGLTGLTALRELASAATELRPAVGLTALETAEVSAAWGGGPPQWHRPRKRSRCADSRRRRTRRSRRTWRWR